MCYEYDFDWYEEARRAEQQRRERLNAAEPKRETAKPEAPSPAPAKREDRKEPVPA
jgi:hypothetical protein